MLQLLSEDLRTSVDGGRRTGLKFWIYLLGRAAIAPQIHALIAFRLGSSMRGKPWWPLAYLLKGFGIVWAGADIHPKAEIGPGFVIAHGTGVTIGADVKAGRNLRVNTGTQIGAMRLTEPIDPSRPTYIGDNVFIGAHAMVLQDCHIGDGAIIGANSVVTRDVPALAVVSGNPAKVVRMLDKPISGAQE
ncbi:MAG TPA: DapH/DapD/GlmU-related protein [Nocardioides sp.]|nr:DapH/DapD/GlmU-related protein [Nocardioides sp.]